MNSPFQQPPHAMDPRRLDALFRELLDTAPEARPTRLAVLCGEDPSLRQALEELLVASEAPVDVETPLWVLRQTYWHAITATRRGNDAVRRQIKNFIASGGFHDPTRF